MRRRRLLGLLAAGSVGVSGCGETSRHTDETPKRRRPSDTEGPYRGAGATLEGTRGVRIRNAGVDERYVTLAIDALGRVGGASQSTRTEVFSTSETLSRAATVVYPALVASADTYRLFVETADGERTVYDWVVDGARSDLDVALDESGVRFTPTVTCTPTCSPLSLSPSPEAFDGPEGSGGVDSHEMVDRERDATAEAFGPAPSFRLDNRAAGWQTVRLSLASSPETTQTTVSRYRIPPSSRLVIPVERRTGSLSVTLDTDTASAERTWPVIVPHLTATVDDEQVTFGCDLDGGRCHVVNDDDGAHGLRIRVEPLSDRTRPTERYYRLESSESTTETGLFDRLGPFSLVVETDDGSCQHHSWLTCPTVGPWYVVVGGDGRVRVSQPVPLGSANALGGSPA
ncbi:hypothetical protein AUR64_15095 [Haloprofundus marisrubri]|uniref:Ig-like domain-containing protein n=1 Tax=Haloprofundus marisrubri TaxID=1514971 RepID=A0A0W1R7C8_9EURY|nr:hypothetical protein [Haloprofundus marisrubri]KTG09121.1 hypothetical protein AUR64_15095 [Haloprofundus marisrubri]